LLLYHFPIITGIGYLLIFIGRISENRAKAPCADYGIRAVRRTQRPCCRAFAQSTPCGCDRAMRNKKGRFAYPLFTNEARVAGKRQALFRGICCRCARSTARQWRPCCGACT